MKEIEKNLELIKNSLASLEGKDKELLNAFYNVIDGIYTKVEEVMVNQAVISENIKYIDDDISELQEELFEELSLEELEEFESDYKEVICSKCGKPVFIETSTIEENEQIPCPYCFENLK